MEDNENSGKDWNDCSLGVKKLTQKASLAKKARKELENNLKVVLYELRLR